MFIFQIKELFQVNNGLATSLLSFFLSFFLNAKNLGRSDDARRRKERGWPCLRIVFSANVINERTHNNRQRNYFAKNFYLKTQILIPKSNSRNTNLARGSVQWASKIGWVHGKNYSTQISNQGAHANLKMYKTSKMKYLQIHKFPIWKRNFIDYGVQNVPENSSKTSLLGCVSKQAKRSDRPWWKFCEFRISRTTIL